MQEKTFQYEGHTFSFHHPLENDHIAKSHAAGVFYETPLLQRVRDLHLQGLYLDAGAHVGNHSVYFSCFCDATEVWAFEPAGNTFQCLVANLATNNIKNVFPFRCAIGRSANHAQLISETPNNSGMNRYAEASTGDIPLFSLDQLTAGVKVAVLKMDIEGFEVPALLGAQQLLTRDRPVVIVEAQTPKETADQESILVKAGYQHAGCYCATPTHLWLPT